jgi:TetR/AcrR family transcriptional regulator, cholesterol catabolism regulator
MARAKASVEVAPDSARTEHAGSRQLILDTAAKLFRHQGYAATSLRDIAAQCGMKAGSLYYHFTSKDAIVAEVLRIGVERVSADVRAAVSRVPAAASASLLIETAVTAHLKALLALQDYTSANLRIFAHVPEATRNDHLHLRDDYERFWAGLFARCARSGVFDPARDLRLARFFLIGAMNGSIEWFDPGRAPIETVATQLAQLLLHGLCRRHSAGTWSRTRAARN